MLFLPCCLKNCGKVSDEICRAYFLKIKLMFCFSRALRLFSGPMSIIFLRVIETVFFTLL